jgi:hypothetical protein
MESDETGAGARRRGKGLYVLRIRQPSSRVAGEPE